MRTAPDLPTEFTHSTSLTLVQAKRIEHWPLDRLVPFPLNPRTHSDAQVAQITPRTIPNPTPEAACSAPERALVEIFVKAFSDPGDVACDPFVGSGTTIAAVQVLNRVGYGVELRASYCDVALRRLAHPAGEEPVLAETGASMTQAAAERGVPYQQIQNPRLRDSRTILHNGPSPLCGSRRKAR